MGRAKEHSEPSAASSPLVNSKTRRGPMSANKALTVMCAIEKVAQEPNKCMGFFAFVARLEVEEPFLGHARAFDLVRSLIAAGKLKMAADADGIETVYIPGHEPKDPGVPVCP